MVVMGRSWTPNLPAVNTLSIITSCAASLRNLISDVWQPLLTSFQEINKTVMKLPQMLILTSFFFNMYLLKLAVYNVLSY